MSITYAQLQQAVARRTGPFFQAAQDSTTPTTSTATSAIMPTLKSSAILGGPENLFLVRRAATNPNDRVRGVLSFDSATGRVIVDANWGTPMAPSEQADFVHLHPEQELKPAVMAGLARCFFADTVGIDPTGPYGGIDVTAQLPWVTGPWQIARVQYGWTAPEGDAPFEATQQGGHVILSGMFGAMAPISCWLTAWHPHSAWVNGADSTTGPSADADTLDVDLHYAAAAGHIEAWHLFPSHMQAAAAGGFQASQAMAAQEFTRQALIWGPKRPDKVRHNEVFRVARDATWINA